MRTSGKGVRRSALELQSWEIGDTAGFLTGWQEHKKPFTDFSFVVMRLLHSEKWYYCTGWSFITIKLSHRLLTPHSWLIIKPFSLSSLTSSNGERWLVSGQEVSHVHIQILCGLHYHWLAICILITQWNSFKLLKIWTSYSMKTPNCILLHFLFNAIDWPTLTYTLLKASWGNYRI